MFARQSITLTKAYHWAPPSLSVMDRFGDNSGGGAPIKSSDGRVITDLRDLGKDLATYKTASPHAR